MKAEIKIYEERFYCKSCMEWIEVKYLSSTKDLCVTCDNVKNAVENSGCLECKEKVANNNFLSQCKKCQKEEDQDEFSNFKGDYTNYFMDNQLKINILEAKKK